MLLLVAAVTAASVGYVGTSRAMSLADQESPKVEGALSSETAARLEAVAQKGRARSRDRKRRGRERLQETAPIL